MIARLKKIDLSSLHFCRENKVKYRVHLSAGMILATFASSVGIVLGIAWLTHVANVANLVTAMIWIWE